MKATRAYLLILPLLLASCGISESRFNPFNWFGGGDDTTTAEPLEVVNVDDPRPLVAEITQLVIERTPGGAIVRVTGLPPTQGWYGAALVNVSPNREALNGVMSYSMRALPPDVPTRVSTRQSRELTAAVFLSDIQLAGVRVIQVTGAQNSRIARR
ncbi:MAG: hypothetical protein HKN27_16375 [Silicimonas sp.]|nr:hypothetical protein [Silicimonas sp.]